MPPALVETIDLKKHFTFKEGILGKPIIVRAVDGVSLTINKGEVFGLVGESGSGKSTLGRLILRLIEPTSGRILFDGTDITKVRGKKLRELRRKMQIVFQDPYTSLHPRKKVLDIVGEPLAVHDNLSKEQIADRVARALTSVGLEEEHMYRYPHEFSGGQRQRIAIARALVLEPEFIVLDEPTSALDVSVQAKILNLLLDLKERFNLTYLLISHNIAVIDYMSNRIGVMYLGKLMELAERDELIRRPLHPYTRALLSSVPIPDPRVAKKRRKLLLKGDPPSPIRVPSGCRFHTRCPYAREKCRQVEPKLEDAGDGHLVACHYWSEIYERDPPTLEWIMSY